MTPNETETLRLLLSEVLWPVAAFALTIIGPWILIRFAMRLRSR